MVSQLLFQKEKAASPERPGLIKCQGPNQICCNWLSSRKVSWNHFWEHCTVYKAEVTREIEGIIIIGMTQWTNKKLIWQCKLLILSTLYTVLPINLHVVCGRHYAVTLHASKGRKGYARQLSSSSLNDSCCKGKRWRRQGSRRRQIQYILWTQTSTS